MTRLQKLRRVLGSRLAIGHPALTSVLMVLVSTALSLAVSPPLAEIYKWVDDSGRIHFSEVPPTSGDSQILVPRSSPAETNRPKTSEKPKSNRFDQKDQKLNEPAEKLRITAENKRIREKNCAAATHNLNTLQSSGRIKLREGDEYRILSPEEQEAKISQSKKHIEQYCD